MQENFNIVLFDVESQSDISPCIKNDLPLVFYTFGQC